MIRKYIPEDYDIEGVDLDSIIRGAVNRDIGAITFYGRTIILHEDKGSLTATEKQAIRSAFMANVSKITALDA